MVAEDDGLAYVIGQAAEAGLDVDDVHVVAVLETERDYLEAIGAIGPGWPTPATPDARRPTAVKGPLIGPNWPTATRAACGLRWSDRGKEVVQLSSHCSHGTSEVAGR